MISLYFITFIFYRNVHQNNYLELVLIFIDFHLHNLFTTIKSFKHSITYCSYLLNCCIYNKSYRSKVTIYFLVCWFIKLYVINYFLLPVYIAKGLLYRRQQSKFNIGIVLNEGQYQVQTSANDKKI